MCWSFSASAIFALIGLVVAGYLAYKKESKLIWIPLAYFGLMEALQAITYLYIGDCVAPMNQLLTLLSYLHISFQPIFINALMLYFIPERFRKKIIGWVFGISFLATIIMLIHLYPFSWAGSCAIGTGLCGETLCSTKGAWHLAWNIPFNGIGGLLLWGYFIPVFVFPLIYGSWKLSLYNFIIGPIIAYLSTNNPNEWPAIWCLMSIGIILILLIPWIRRKFHVRKWYFWEYPHKCEKCKHWWIPDSEKHPLKCPKCKSRYWHQK